MRRAAADRYFRVELENDEALNFRGKELQTYSSGSSGSSGGSGGGSGGSSTCSVLSLTDAASSLLWSTPLARAFTIQACKES